MTPGCDPGRAPETSAASGVGTVRNSLENMDAILQHAAQAACGCLREGGKSLVLSHQRNPVAQRCADNVDKIFQQGISEDKYKEFQKCSKIMADMIILIFGTNGLYSYRYGWPLRVIVGRPGQKLPY
jgi:hypothetical protein